MTQILAEVITIHLIETEASAEKMIIVDEGVFHPGPREARRDLRLPHALGNPRAARPRLEVFLDIVSEPRNLRMAILRWNGHENRLVESAADNFRLASGNKLAKKLEVFWVRRFDPLQERAGVMQSDANLRMVP